MIKPKTGILYFTGCVLLLSTAVISFLSHQFVFGQAHAHRPIPLFLFWVLVSFTGYFAAVLNVQNMSRLESSPKTFLWIFIVAILCRLFYFSSELIQETDPYRYVWDGQMVLKGMNPYSLSPNEASKKAPSEKIFRRINHPSTKTIYPPGAQGLFAFSQKLTPGSFLGWRALIFAAELLIFFLLFSILQETALPLEWTLFYAWSPLVLKEFSNSLHLDVFAVLFLCLAIYGLFKEKMTMAFAALALAIGVKWFALVLLPLFLTWGLKWETKKALMGLIFFAGLLLAVYSPFLSAGRSLFEGLFTFFSKWHVNEGLSGVISTALSWLRPGEISWVNASSRIVSAAILAFSLVWACRKVLEKKDLVVFCRNMLGVLAVLFFVSPAANPWYFTWVIPFLIFYPSKALFVFSGLVFLYYLDFYLAYQGWPELFLWVKMVEYGLFFLIMGWETWKQKAQGQASRLFCPWQTNEI